MVWSWPGWLRRLTNTLSLWLICMSRYSLVFFRLCKSVQVITLAKQQELKHYLINYVRSVRSCPFSLKFDQTRSCKTKKQSDKSPEVKKWRHCKSFHPNRCNKTNKSRKDDGKARPECAQASWWNTPEEAESVRPQWPTMAQTVKPVV